jgi:gluconolactonase
MTELTEITAGLQFPEGPVALDDGGILLVELQRHALSRVHPDGRVDLVADCGGSPNGAAFGPDGRVYICNNGGFYTFSDVEGIGNIPTQVTDHGGGSIQAVDLDSGAVETIYTECEGRPLIAPNDLVFDSDGGFYFTDHGVGPDNDDSPGVLYAKPDGSYITGLAYGIHATNGIGLAPDERHLYVAQTHEGKLLEWAVVAPGEIVGAVAPDGPHGGRLLHKAPDGQLFDSLAVDGEGWVNIATIVNGGITSVSPDGDEVIHTPVPDAVVTNICFGGDALGTAFITASATGKLYSTPWARPGLDLAF